MTDTKLSVVIPAYNEASIIVDTINIVLQYLDRNFRDYELIISDDGSTDETKALVEAFGSPRLRCVGHFPNEGKGSAVREGVLAAGGDIIVCTDADLAYGVEVIEPMVQRLAETGADLVIGSRKLHPEGYADYPPLRLVASRSFSFITGLFAGFNYDTQCGIKVYTRDTARSIFSRCETSGFAFDFEVLMLATGMAMSIEQYPVMIINHRESKVNVFSDSVKMLNDVIKIRRSVKMRID